MAKINNPIQPTNDPNYTGSTRPISIPEDIRPQGAETNRILPRGVEQGDRSAEFEGKAKAYASEAQGMSEKGNADLFAGIVGIGDFLGKAGVQVVKKNIEDEVYNLADAERQRYTQILQGIRDGKGVQNILAGSSDGDTPSDIKELPDQLSVLQSAKDGGKLRSTDYRARLAALAKDLRAKYPGFRNEIDEEFKKVTGMNPANSVITGLIADINAQSHGASSLQNKAISFVLSHEGDFDNAGELIQKIQNNEIDLAGVVNLSAPRARMRAVIQDRKAVYDDSQLTDKAKAQAGVKLIDTVSDIAVTNFVAKFTKQMRLETDEQAKTMEIRSKNGGISSQRWQELGQLYATGVNQLRESMWADARKYGLVQSVGADEVEKRINVAIRRAEVIKDRIYAADVGGIHNAAKTIKAMQDDDIKDAMNSPLIGGPLRVSNIVRNLAGDQYVANLAVQQAREGLVGKLSEYAKGIQNAMAAQQDMKTSGIPLTLNRVFDEYKDKLKDAPEREKAAIVNSTVNRVLSIADPETPDVVKYNYALAAFSPDRKSFINRLNKDSYDAKGRPTRGQNAVFQDMTSEAMAKSIYELDKKHPGIFKLYTDWVTETLDNDLLSRDVRELNQIRNPTVRVGWDSDNKRLVTNFNPTPVQRGNNTFNPMSSLDRAKSALTQNSMGRTEEGRVAVLVNRINNNLSGFKNIAKVSGADVDAYILRNFAAAAGPEALSQVDNLPASIIRDIGLSKLKKKQ